MTKKPGQIPSEAGGVVLAQPGTATMRAAPQASVSWPPSHNAPVNSGSAAWGPRGGFVLACTSGVMHIFLQEPSAGLYAMFASVLYGVIHALGPRRLAPTVALIGLAFIA